MSNIYDFPYKKAERLEQPQAAERVVRTWKLPNGIEFSILLGWYRNEVSYPLSFRAARGGRVAQARTPWGALSSLLEFEKRPLRPV